MAKKTKSSKTKAKKVGHVDKAPNKFYYVDGKGDVMEAERWRGGRGKKKKSGGK